MSNNSLASGSKNKFCLVTISDWADIEREVVLDFLNWSNKVEERKIDLRKKD